jgi:outer membrane protein
MKIHYSIFLFALLLSPDVRGQQQSGEPTKTSNPASFTLEQCIAYGLHNAVNVINSGVDEQIAGARVKELIGSGLPQINGTANVTYNTQLPHMFFTKERAYGFIAGSSGLTYDQFLPGVSDNAVVASPNLFQLKGSSTASLTLTQMIFNGSYFVGLQAAKTYKELAYKTTNQTKEQVIELITKAYYSALINRERMNLFDNNIARVDSLYRSTKALNQNGFAEAIDVDRVQVTLNNLITERDRFTKLQELSVELLKFQMNFPMNQPLVVVGDITRETVSVDWENYLKDWNYRNRSSYQILEANHKLQLLNVKNRYAAYMPVLNFNANAGYMLQAATLTGLFQPPADIPSNQFGLGAGRWYPVSYYGVSFNLPIFSGGQRNYQLQQERLRLDKIENSYKYVENTIDLEVKQATITYENAVESLQVQRRNMGLAGNVEKVTKVKYEQGVGSNIEVVDAEASLRESQVNFYNALYDALLAKVDLDKAFGKLLPNVQVD